MKTKIFLIIVFLLVGTEIVFSQNVEALRNYLKQLGKSEEEVQSLLKSYGFVKEEPDTAQVPEVEGPKTLDTLEVKKKIEEAEEEAEVETFGYKIFGFAPTYKEPVFETGIVSDEYPIGPGDEIILSVWGQDEKYKTYQVDRDGGIYIERLGKIYVNGLSFKELENFLKGRLSTIFSGISTGETQVDITLGKLRKIQVFVTGEVKIPSDYYVNPLSYSINLIYMAGGLTEGGSLRNIQLKRGNKIIKTYDLYKFILEGEFDETEKLQDYDVLHVPFARKKVTIKGEINRPAEYELKEEETIGDLIEFAGGFKSTAYLGKFNIIRIIPPERRKKGENEKEVITFYDLKKFLSQIPLDGDQISIFKIKDIKENFVKIIGRVKKIGEFEYQPGLELSELIDKAEGMEEEAYLDKVLVIRTRPDSSQKLISVNYNNVLEGREKVELEPRDKVLVFSKWDFEDKGYVEIKGEVREPGQYKLMDNMTLNDLIHLAGGLEEEAYRYEAEISRLIPDSLKKDKKNISKSIKIDLMSGSKELSKETFLLERYDNVFIRKNPKFSLPKYVSILGEVKYPGDYPLLNENERITDLINRAGGLNEDAYIEGIKFTRKEKNIGDIAVDFKNILKNPEDVQNFTLKNGDIIDVPQRLNTVKVMGNVGFPVSVPFFKDKGISFYIERAGGYLKDSDKERIQIIYPNGQITTPRKFWFDPDIKPGSTIIIPKKKVAEGVDWADAIRNWVQVISGLATTIYILKNIQK